MYVYIYMYMYTFVNVGPFNMYTVLCVLCMTLAAYYNKQCCTLCCIYSNESSDSMGGGQTTAHDIEDKLGSALNPNRAEMPGKRKTSYDQVCIYTCTHNM